MTTKTISKAASADVVQRLAVLDNGLFEGLVLGFLVKLCLLCLDLGAAEGVCRNADSDEENDQYGNNAKAHSASFAGSPFSP